ncbi:hypothetical protein ACOMHN_059773 [Nucella lapillus]
MVNTTAVSAFSPHQVLSLLWPETEGSSLLCARTQEAWTVGFVTATMKNTWWGDEGQSPDGGLVGILLKSSVLRDWRSACSSSFWFIGDQPKPTPLVIRGEDVELVDQYKYLGSIIDSKLSWSANAQALLKKGNQRLFFVRRLNSFGVGPRLPKLFYRATVESVLTFNSLCFFSSLKEHDKGKLANITMTARKLIGRPVPDLETLFEAKAISGLKAIQQDPSHPLCDTVLAQVSARSGRLVSFRARTDRFRDSFLPTAVRLTNNRN